MNLFDFESYVPKRIEDRGYDYYMGGMDELERFRTTLQRTPRQVHQIVERRKTVK